MKRSLSQRALSLLLTLSLAAGLLPATAFASPANSVTPSTVNVYAFNGPTTDALNETPITTIDLGQPIYLYASNGIRMSGLCLWAVESETDVPSADLLNSVYRSQQDGDRFGDGLYTLTGNSSSTRLGSTLVYGSGANVGGLDDATQKYYCNAGFQLKYQAGSKYTAGNTLLVPPGKYRFVMYYGDDLFYSSDVFTITDSQNVRGTAKEGTLDVTYKVGGSPVTSVKKGSTDLAIEISDLVLGNAHRVSDLSVSGIAEIDLMGVGGSGFYSYYEFAAAFKCWGPTKGSLDTYEVNDLALSGDKLILSNIHLPDEFYDYRVMVTTTDGGKYISATGLHSVADLSSPVIATRTLGEMTAGQTVTYTLEAQKVDSSHTLAWSITNAGDLGDKLSIDANTGKLTVTDPNQGTYTFTVKVEESSLDASANSATQTYTLTVAPKPKFYVGFDPQCTVTSGDAYSSHLVEKGAQVTVPATPTKPGYDFQGWGLYNSNTGKYDLQQGVAAGSTVTVNADTYYYALWRENDPVTVTVAGLNPLTNWALVGYKDASDTYGTTLAWSDNKLAAPSPIQLKAENFYYNNWTSFTRLELRAPVNGEWVTVAHLGEKGGTPVMNEDSCGRTLTLIKDKDYIYVTENDIHVKAEDSYSNLTTLTKSKDYYGVTFYNRLKQSLRLPTPLFRGDPNPVLTADVWESWDAQKRYDFSSPVVTMDAVHPENGVTVTVKQLEKVRVSGKVYKKNAAGNAWENVDQRYSYYSVYASQAVNGRGYYTESRLTPSPDGDGSYSYSLELYKNNPVTLQVSYGSLKIVLGGPNDGGEDLNNRRLEANQMSDSRSNCNLCLYDSSVSVSVEAQPTETQGQADLVDRYLRASRVATYNDICVTGTDQVTDRKYYSYPYPRRISRDSFSAGDSAADATLSVTAYDSLGLLSISKRDNTGAFTYDPDKVETVKLKDGVGTVTLKSRINSGIVVPLRAEVGGPFLLAWFDATGKLIGTGEPFYLGRGSGDVASVCPKGDTTGTFTVALMPRSYGFKLGETWTTLAQIQAAAGENALLNTWEVTLRSHEVTELTPFTANATQGTNALYVTKPNTTLFANKTSFYDTDDLVTFTGTIGLDDGLEQGKLTKVSIDCSNGSVFGNSALPTQLVINGTSYTNTATLHGTHYDFQFTNQPIDLPCTYTLYALPGTANADMHVNVTCDVGWAGGSSNYEPIGSAVVTRPKTTITTLSGSVGSDTVPLQGMAPSYDSQLTIYDGDTVIGTAKAVNRKWSGVFPLADTDPNYTTVHLLRAVDDATGSESRTISLYHRKGGPQLTSLRMKWSTFQHKTTADQYLGWYEMDVGGSYTFLPGGMWHTTVTAVVENCQELDTLSPVAGSSADKAATGLGSYKVLFRVRTDDGEIRLIPGEETVTGTTGTTGTYVGTLPEHLGSFVASVEPILLPKLHNSYDKTSDHDITVHAFDKDGKEIGAFAQVLLSAAGKAAESLQTELADAPKEAYTVTFDKTGAPTVSGSTATLSDAETARWKLVNQSMWAQGQQLASYTHETHATKTLVEWLDELYDSYTPTEDYMTYSSSRVYASVTDYENERKALADNATDAIHLDGLGSQMSYHSYVVTDGVKDGEGNVTTPATYKINVDFVTCAGLYMSQASVVLYPGFAGYTDRRMVALGGRTVPMSRILASAGPLDGSMLVALGGHAGSYWYGGHYTANTSALDILANNNFYGSNGVNYGKVIMDGLDTGKVFAEFSEYLGGLVDLAGGLGAVMDALSAALDFQRDEKMDQDLITLMSTPCYMKLDARQKALAESYYRDFLWVKGERQKLDVISKIGNFFVYILTSGWFAGLVNGLATGVKAQIFAFLDECAFVATGVQTTTSVEAVTAVGTTSMSVFGCIAAIVSGLLAMATASQLHANLAETYNNAFTRISDMCNRKAYEYGDPNCKEPDDEDDEEDAIRRSEYRRKYAQDMRKNAVSVDPSGIVYEGVIENSVEGADVTLYYAVDGSNQLVRERLVTDGETGLKSGTGEPDGTVAQLLPADRVENMTPEGSTQRTGEDGLYQWFVPQGLWYVTAEKPGYEPGSSNNDKAAKVANVSAANAGSLPAGTYNLLPVLPAQLEVNIPLRDATAPVVTEARYTTDGVYLTFSKYMVDDDSATSVRNSANYTVKVNGVADGRFTVTSVEQGHTPANLDGDNTKTYSRTVLVKPSVTVSEGNLVEVLVKSTVSSYYPTPMGADYLAVSTVASKPTLAPPAFSGKDGNGAAISGTDVTVQMNRGDSVTLSLPDTAPEGARIYYTTDDNAPTTSSAVYSAPIPVTGTMTIKAIAAALGYTDSAVSVGSFTVKGTQTVLFTLSGQVTTTSGSPDGLTLTLTDAAGTVSRTAVVSGGRYAFTNLLKDTVYTVSFAGNGTYPAASVRVTLGETDAVQNITLGRRPSSGTSGGGSGSDSYGVKAAETAHGAVTVSPKTATAGQKVTLTPKPDQGYELDTLTVTDKSGKALTLTATDGVYTFTMPAGEVTVTATFRESPTADFPDVAPGAWYYEAVQWAAGKGITTGKPGGVFDPTGEASRAEVVTFLWRCAGAPEPETTTSPFSDVAEVAWYLEPVLWAAEKGIALGFGDGTFRPDAIVTREQFVTFLYRMVGSAVNGPNPFTDVETGDWSYGAVLWAAKNAITNGTGGGLFSPEGICDRGQTVTMLHRWFGRE